MSNYCKNCYELTEKLEAKEQECDRLKHDNDYEIGALEKTIDNLTAENEELKNDNEELQYQLKCTTGREKEWECNCKFWDARCEKLQTELDQLKAKLEQEKALKETYLTCYKAKHEDIDGELFKLKQRIIEIDRSYKNRQEELEQTLTEIKEIAIGNFYYLDCNYRWILEEILQKISEVENENI